MRVAQLVRSPTITPPSREGDVVIELGGARITISRGAELTAVVTVLALLGGRS